MMIKIKSLNAVVLVFIVSASGCAYRDLSPRIVAVNLYDRVVDLMVSDSLGNGCLVEDVKPNGSSVAFDLEKPGYYTVGWKTGDAGVWQGGTTDRMFPDLSGGPCLLEKNTLNCILADKAGIIRVFPLEYPAGYGAKICLVNASDFTMDELSFADGAGTQTPLVELGATPPLSITRFVNVLPGGFSWKAVFRDSAGNEAAAAMSGPVVLDDNTCHIFIACLDGSGMVLKHFVTGTGNRVTSSYR